MLCLICFVSGLCQIHNPEGTEILQGSCNLRLLLVCKCTGEGQGCNEAKQSRKGRDPLQPWNYFVKREEWLGAKSSAGERLWDPCCRREVKWPLMPTRLPGPNGMCPVLLVSPATRHSFDECHGPQNNLLWFRIAWNQRFLILTWF